MNLNLININILDKQGQTEWEFCKKMNKNFKFKCNKFINIYKSIKGQQ